MGLADNLLSKRTSGVLLHLTSLPGREGIGTLGHPAYRFIDFLHKGGQSFWQILPIGPTPLDGNPYLPYCSFAGNSLLICMDVLRENGLVSDADISSGLGNGSESVDFQKVALWKLPLLRSAAMRLQKLIKRGYQSTPFSTFCYNNDYWLNDYALFTAITSSEGISSWTDLPEAMRNRHPEEIAFLAKDLSQDIDIIR
ncbi:MAG: 4-alpha-glucanotransferase, partial [Methylococcaceae bacterium]